MVHVAFLRSQFGHAEIVSVETESASEMDGVVAVYTGADMAASAVSGLLETPARAPNGVETPRPAMVSECVRYTGEVVAAVVAEDRYTAHDALDRIEIEYSRLDAVVDPIEALDSDAPVIHQHAEDNVAFELSFGDDDAVESAFQNAATTASVSLRNQRLIGDPMEPRVALADYEDGTLTMTVASQTPHGDKAGYASALGLDEDSVRVVSPAVGGGFGIKGGPYPDEVTTAWCSLQLERPVKWTATRTEGHVADYQSRDWHLNGELAMDDDGSILGLSAEANHTVGAYYCFGPTLSPNFERLIQGQYEIPAISGHIIGSFTNTTPIAAYRGAGRPEVIYLLERLIDAGAREIDMDPAEFRRKNLIPADAFPYETTLGSVYDSGDYEGALEVALDAVDYEHWRQRQAELRDEDRYIGIGLASFVENSGSSPGMGETARIELNSDGTATAYFGTHDHGQGHKTTFSQLLADVLGFSYEDIDIVEGDTTDLADGVGTFGSRSAALGGAAGNDAALELIEEARERAAKELEADVEDIEFDNGTFHISGVPDRSIELTDVAGEMGEKESLAATVYYDPPNYGWTFGTHATVVEVDPNSGEIDFHDYVSVEDCGTVINPLIVEGQIHGGVAQGIAQALYEEAVFDDTGTLLSGSLQDYAIPKAYHVPEIRTYETETPSPHHPLGIKGTGESGTIAATPAVANAVADALAPFGVEDITLPIKPEKVWQAADGK